MSRDLSHGLTRREALAAGAATLGALALGVRPSRADDADRYGPFKMGLQSYSLRHFKRDEALAKTKELGLHYWESFPAHVPLVTDPEQVVKYRDLTQSYGVSVIGYGVMHFGKNEDDNRKAFEFAKKMGIGYLSADPDPDSFDGLDKLCEEFGVAIGIHPHGPGSRWDTIDKTFAAVKDHHEKIGLCNDTGHLLRSREDPVRAVEVFGKRVYGVHLKDVRDAKTFTELGKGDLRTADLLKVLVKNNYNYCLALEYEEHPEDPEADIRECLKAAREAAATLKNA